jgi:hypothetical protein
LELGWVVPARVQAWVYFYRAVSRLGQAGQQATKPGIRAYVYAWIMHFHFLVSSIPHTSYLGMD